MERTMFKSTISEDENLRNLYPSSTSNEVDSLSDTEENETIYLVTNDANKMDLLLIVSDQSIREKNSLTGRTINKWAMAMLESCECIRTDVVCIRFDTIKKDKRERTYRMTESGDGKKLDDFLRKILSERPLSEMMIVFRCANCALQFSQEKLPRKKGNNSSFFLLSSRTKLNQFRFKLNSILNFSIFLTVFFFAVAGVKCPDCNSTYVIEMKEQEPELASSSPPKQSEPVPLDKSNSHSSIGKTSSCLVNISNHTLIYFEFNFIF